MNVLFDLDGTLTDSREGILACIRHALTGLGHPSPDDDRMRGYIGPPLTESFGALLGDDPQRVGRAIALYRERFTSVGMFENAVYDGVPQALMAIQSAGARLFVATSKPRVFAQRILQHFGLDRFFEAIYGSELDGTRSAKADLIEYVLEDAALEPAATAMIGDRMHDMMGARAHGVIALGAVWGYGSREELLSAGAAALCERPDEILPRLQRTLFLNERDAVTSVREVAPESSAIVIVTRRLTLQRLTLQEAPFILELLNEPGWLRFIGDKGVRNLEDARRYLRQGPLASYQRFGFGLYLVTRSVDGALLGMCGLIKRDNLSDVDIGFALLSRHHGAGYASEAAAAVMNYARTTLGLIRVLAITDIDNIGSARVLEDIGMRFERMIKMSPAEPDLRLFTSDR